MLVDYHVHALAHGEYKCNQDWLNLFIDQACSRGIKEMGFSEHNEFITGFDLDVYRSVKTERQRDIHLRLGIEVDYTPGLEGEIQALLTEATYDYSIGSVHFIDGWAFDHPDYKHEFAQRDIDTVYARYAEILISMARSQLFDIVGHLDLVKIWGDRPGRKDTCYYIEPVLTAIRAAGMVVEINSAGLRKPVGEIYPSAALLKLMFAKNIPITLGSDAHHPEQMGEGLREACLSARQAGYRSLTTFSRHQKTLVAL